VLKHMFDITNVRMDNNEISKKVRSVEQIQNQATGSLCFRSLHCVLGHSVAGSQEVTQFQV